jgi:hypothetical protein
MMKIDSEGSWVELIGQGKSFPPSNINIFYQLLFPFRIKQIYTHLMGEDFQEIFFKKKKRKLWDL